MDGVACYRGRAPEVYPLAEVETDDVQYVPTTRREARLAYEARAAIAKKQALVKKAPAAVPAAFATPKPKRRFKGLANAFVMLIAAGIIGTVAIPAYAFNPSTQGQGQFGSSVVATMKKENAQSVDVAAGAVAPVAQRDTYSATTAAELSAAKAKVAQAAAVKQLTAYAKAYTGPTAGDYLKNPAYPNFSLGQVFSVAQQYIGTQYVYGGATPAGFDCSGYIMFVYSQFGIALPHSASAQGAIGTKISVDAAQPGDVIVLNNGSHDGFFAGRAADGGVLIMDAPERGKTIQIRKIWTDAFYVVRFGI